MIRSITSCFAGVCMAQSLFKLFACKPSLIKRVFLYLLFGVAIALPSWVGDENPLLIFPFFLLSFWLFLTGTKKQKFIMGSIFYTMLISINMLIDSQNADQTMILIMSIGKMLIWCSLSLLLQRITPAGGLQLSKRLWLLLGGLCLAPLMAMLSFSIWGNTFQTEADYQFYFSLLKRFSLTILPFVIVSSFTLLIAAVVLSRHETMVQENKLSALREVYYESLKKEQLGLRTLRHDLRNHVTALQGLLELGMLAELSQYLADLQSSPSFNNGCKYTQNETANIVLSSKAAHMALSGLVPDFEVLLPETLPLPGPELCALFGNSLDNAIEAAAGANNPIITLRVRLDKGMFMMQVQNAVYGKINPDLSTTKEDDSRHGFGLAGMRQIAERHGGSLETTFLNGHFTLFICFPCD